MRKREASTLLNLSRNKLAAIEKPTPEESHKGVDRV